MPCKTWLCRNSRETCRAIGGHKTKYACIVEADESMRIRLESSSSQISWRSHFRKKYEFIKSLQSGAQIYSCASSNENTKCKGSSGKKKKKTRENPDMAADESQKTKMRWSKKQGMSAEKVHFASVMDLFHLKNSELEPQFQKYKGRVALRGDIVKDDSGSCAVFTEHGSSASQMTAAKVMDTKSRLPGCARQAADAVSAYTRSKWKMHRRHWKFQSQNVQIFGYDYQSTTGQNHGPVWKIQSFLLNEI